MKFLYNSKYIILIIFLSIFFYSSSKYKKIDNHKIFLDTTYTVKTNSSASSLISFFSKNGLISGSIDKISYKIHLKLHNYKLLAGTYKLHGEYSIPDLLLEFTKGGNVFVTLSIPEGFRCEEIAKLVEQNFKIDSLDFITAVLDNGSARKYQVNTFGNLRGYLLPETYQFYPNASIETIILKLTKEFNEFYNASSKLYNKTNLNKTELLTLASIIEKESIVSSERRLISGVFYHRLRNNMLLQTDPTIRFATNNFLKPILSSQLRFDSPYNTYIYKGLPPTPICNPGKQSILAAMDPIDTDFIYFMAKFDGSNEHYFAKSYIEHLSNVKKGRSNLRNSK